jgi:hypothetical protein
MGGGNYLVRSLHNTSHCDGHKWCGGTGGDFHLYVCLKVCGLCMRLPGWPQYRAVSAPTSGVVSVCGPFPVLGNTPGK